MRTLERTGDLAVCACGRRYPIVDGIPLLLANGVPDLTGVVERELAPDVTALLLEHAREGSPYPHLADQLGMYLDAQWGDRADPPPDGVAFGAAELVDRIAARAGVRVALAVELGCSVGRVVAELAAGADHVVGLDIQLAALRRARRLLAGAPLGYARRIVGCHYTPAHVTPAGPVNNVTLVCGDALDPPLVHGFYDRVVALNLLDSVPDPLQLLAVIDGLCAPGGEVILASPYAWQASTTPIGGADPAAAVAAHLTECGYVIEDEALVPWHLRRNAHCALTYRTHYIRARKGT